MIFLLCSLAYAFIGYAFFVFICAISPGGLKNNLIWNKDTFEIAFVIVLFWPAWLVGYTKKNLRKRF